MTRKPETPAAAEFRTSGEETREGLAAWRRPAVLHSAYPFAGIVGMADLKLALLLNAVSPAIGGVLVRGEKGTAKSTMVRGLAALLPPVPVVPGCRFSCDPAAPDPRCPAGPHDGHDIEPVPPGHPGRAPGRGHRGPAGRLARHRARADRGHHRLPARPAGRGAPRRALRRRGQPAPRPPGRPAARRGRAGRQLRRARGDLGPARLAVPAGRHHEPGGGRAAPAAARPVRPDRARRRPARTRPSGPRWSAAGWPSRPTRRGFAARFAADTAALAERRSRRLATGCLASTCRTPRSARSARCAARSAWTGCVPTWSPPGPRSRWPPGPAATW